MAEQPETTFTVLVIEDNESMARLIRRYVMEGSPEWRRGPVEVEEADSLTAGLEALAETVYDVVLLDLGLPETDGLQTLDRVVGARPDLPVVVLTSLEDNEVAVRAIREGAQDYLVKSRLDGERLWRAMRYATERKRIERGLRRHNERLTTLASLVGSQLSEPIAEARERLAALQEDVDAGEVATVSRTLRRLESLAEEVRTVADEVHTVGDQATVPLEAAVDRAWRIVRTDAAAIRLRGSLGVTVAEEARVVELLAGVLRTVLEAAGDDEVLVEVGPLDDGSGVYVADVTATSPVGGDPEGDPGEGATAAAAGPGLSAAERIAAEYGWEIDVVAAASGRLRVEVREFALG